MTKEHIHVTFDGSAYKLHGLPTRLTQKSQELFDVTLARGLSVKTVRAYAYDLAIFFRWHCKQSSPFSKLDQRTLVRFMKNEHQKERKPATVNRRLNSIQVFFRFCFNKKISGTLITEKGKRFLTYDRFLGVYPVFTR